MKISEKRLRELLDRYLSNEAAPGEKEMLDRFFNSYRHDLSDSDLFPKEPCLEEEILHAIHTRVGANIHDSNNKVRKLWLPLAAAISLFVLTYFFIGRETLSPGEQLTNHLVEEQTNAGQKLLTTLPDGTRVHLNGDSKISYPKTFESNFREVSLTGEGYFEVVKDTKPFVVHTHKIKTEVLGTSFNVKNMTGENVEITLVEGKVNVVSPGGESPLKPHQQAVVVVRSGEIHTKEVDIERYISWKDNILFFHETGLKEAVSILESWYAVKIDVANSALEKCVITAKYQDEPLGNVLSSFQFLLNLKITRISESHYSISGKGCK